MEAFSLRPAMLAGYCMILYPAVQLLLLGSISLSCRSESRSFAILFSFFVPCWVFLDRCWMFKKQHGTPKFKPQPNVYRDLRASLSTMLNSGK